ncbi:MAG: TonB-dependent receptor [Methylococcaceae bacterium]
MKVSQLFRNYQITWAIFSIIVFFSNFPAYAHTQDEADAVSDLGVLVITGRASDLLGQTDTASAGIIGQPEFEFRPLSRPGELVEVVPGMMATQHSGSGKANQFFLRGFNLDHGTDFSGMVDGVPLNLPTHGHGQGYLDLNSIIPELVDQIEFGKGPYHAEMGDFSSAGYVNFHTKHYMEKGLAKLGFGEDGYYRGVLADSYKIGPGDLLFGAEVNFYQGPWERDENVNKFNGLLRYTVDDGYKGYSLVGTVYHNNWDSTEQIPKRAVDQQNLSNLGTIDDTAGGDMERYSLSGNWWRDSEYGETELSAYGVYSNFNLYSNFTYFLNDPVNGDQITQRDRRYTFGGKAKHTKYNEWFDFDIKNIIGLQVRHDYIPNVALYKSQNRTILSTISEHKVNQTSIGLYGENEIQWMEKFKSILGLRGDFYIYDVESRLMSVNSGETNDAQFSPKLSFVLGPWYDTEYYLNLGYGFHSNDARGTTINFDPESGNPVKAVDPLVSSRGAEIGMRTQYIPGLVSTLSLWWLELDSELVFVGDGGGTESSGKSQRYGLELTNYYKPFDWLTLDFDVALTQSEFTGVPANQKEVPNSVGTTLSGGATIDLPNGLFGSLRVRHFDDIPLTEAGSIFADSTTVVNLGTGYRYKDFRLELNVLNLFDSGDSDITYYYESRLDGETTGVGDIHFHPVEPRTIRVQASMQF